MSDERNDEELYMNVKLATFDGVATSIMRTS
jgi:hypothetical protein